MTKSITFRKTMFLSFCLTLGCTGSGAAGCGSSDGNGTPQVESDLPGVYSVTTYQSSPFDEQTGDPIPDSCDQLADATRLGDFLVLYSFVPNGQDDPALGGVFCSDVQVCQGIGREGPQPAFGYTFIQGDDASGWRGFGTGRQGRENDQCLLGLQVHDLTATGDSVRIETNAVEVTFPPQLDGNDATCAVADGLAAYNADPDLPCLSRILAEATRTAGL